MYGCCTSFPSPAERKETIKMETHNTAQVHNEVLSFIIMVSTKIVERQSQHCKNHILIQVLPST